MHTRFVQNVVTVGPVTLTLRLFRALHLILLRPHSRRTKSGGWGGDRKLLKLRSGPESCPRWALCTALWLSFWLRYRLIAQEMGLLALLARFQRVRGRHGRLVSRAEV